MDNKELDRIIHETLLPIKQSFVSYQQLANGNFRFDPKIFRRCAVHIEEVITIVRNLTQEE